MYTWDRIPRNASGRLVDDVFEPPDIAVEIVSPDQSFRELVVRSLWYLAHGVRVALLVDPDRPLVAAFRPTSEPIALQDEGLLDLGDVIPNFALDVAALFEELGAD